MQAILYQELTETDWLDPLADLMVACYWRFQPLWDLLSIPAKKDSSTGYGQIFAATAINALNYAYENGVSNLPISVPLDPHADLCRVWRKLHRDMHFNVRCVALCLLHAAALITGRTDFNTFSPDDIQLVFTRYNANTQRVTAYGKAAYDHYQNFQGGSL